MTDIINSPLFLTVLFSAITVLGAVPLLRWALSERFEQAAVPVSLSLACLIAVLCALGQPSGLGQYGMNALFYALVGVTVWTVLSVFLIQHAFMRFVWALVLCLVWCWIVIGLPITLSQAWAAIIGLLVLVFFVFILQFRIQAELGLGISPARPLSGLIVVTAILAFMIFDRADEPYFIVSAGLLTVMVCALVWCFWARTKEMQVNAFSVPALMVATLGWVLWQAGAVPIGSLLFLGMVPFTDGALRGMNFSKTAWAEKSYPFLLSVFYGAPVLLALILFDILQPR